MGMAGELQKCALRGRLLGKLRLVPERDRGRAVGNPAKVSSGFGSPSNVSSMPADPEVVAAKWDADRFVTQHGNSALLERRPDLSSRHGEIMIAKDADHAKRRERFELREHADGGFD